MIKKDYFQLSHENQKPWDLQMTKKIKSKHYGHQTIHRAGIDRSGDKQSVQEKIPSSFA